MADTADDANGGLFYTSASNVNHDVNGVGSTGDVTLRLDRTVETRFVLIYLTELPKRGTYYQGSIAEIQVGR